MSTMKKFPLSSIAQQLTLAFESATQEKEKTSKEESIKVNETISSIAFLYEKVRNVVDYKEDHLFRISAIERSLIRQFFLKNKSKKLGESLIRELIRSGYLQNQAIPIRKVQEVDQILEKYRELISQLPKKGNGQAKKWVLSIASSEIEKTLAPQEDDEALVAAFYQLMGPEVNFPNDQKKKKSLQLFIASQRSLLKSSLATLRYNLLLGYLPNWPSASKSEISQLAGDLSRIINEI